MNVRAATRLFVLLGDPVAHSRSPIIQNVAIRACGIDAVYIALPTPAQHLHAIMRTIAGAGGGGNITIPHKRNALLALDRCTGVVTATQACNTFWGEDGKLVGDNTDVAGFTAAAQGLLGAITDIRALVIGAGGAASAAVHAFVEQRAARVDILSRRHEAARRLADRADGAGHRVHAVSAPAELAGETVDFVVNATPLGLRETDPLPFQLDTLGSVGAALDMVYSATSTPFVRHAQQLGIRAIDGGEMLIAQGEASFERWFGHAPPAGVMRAAFDRSSRD